jgi:amino acid transporter
MARTKNAKRVVLGRQMATHQLGETLLPKRLALPVFASDALSSNAYATQEILIVLSLAGFAFFAYTPYIALAVVFVFAVVVLSYRQNVHAYPSGGGDYEVVSTNLGQRAGVFVASALLVDYILTVAVSISSAVANISSAVPGLGPYKVEMAVALIVALALMNLRGVRESGSAFAIPTYLFMFAIFTMLIVAAARLATGDVLRAESADWEIEAEMAAPAGLALAFLLARAFSSGTTALTGVEAISNGVPAFEEPKSKNAATTLALLGVISMTMFTGITWLALQTGVKVAERNEDLVGLPPGQEQKTVIAQIAQAVYSGFPIGAVLVAIVTALILVLAANTAFNGFPVLGSILAADGFLPRQLRNRGDRLAFSNGILMLALAAIAIVVGYGADVSKIIQLYIVGVFVSFTLSQLGMVRHWTRHLRTEQDRGERARMRRNRVINAVGFVLTGSVLTIVLITKFTRGAWIVCIAMPVLYGVMYAIRRHYDRFESAMAIASDARVTLPSRVHAVVLVARLDAPTLRALRYAAAQRPTAVEGIHIDVDGTGAHKLLAEWDRRGITMPLRIVASPYREVGRPILEHVAGMRRSSPRDLVMVLVPTYAPDRWWKQLLHKQTALRLRNRLQQIPGVMVASVPQTTQGAVEIAEQVEAAVEAATASGTDAPASPLRST